MRNSQQIGRLLIPALILSMLPMLAACNKDNEVLAEFDGGTITRAELRFIHELRHAGHDHGSETLSVEEQIETLNDYALLRLASTAARKAGLDVDQRFKTSQQLSHEWATLNAYDRFARSESSGFEYEMMTLQFVWLRGAQSEGEPSRRGEAEAILTELNNASSSDAINQIVTRSTENNRYRATAGLIDPHCINCRPDPLDFVTVPAKEAAGKFTLVEDDGSYWLVRSVETRNVRTTGLEAHFDRSRKEQLKLAERYIESIGRDDPNYENHEASIAALRRSDMSADLAEAQIARQKDQQTRGRLERLGEKHNFDSRQAALTGQTADGMPLEDTTPLFVFGEEFYTYNDLRQRLKDIGELTLDQELNYLHSVILPYEIIKRDPDYRKVTSSSDYKLFRQMSADETLANLYFEQNEPRIELSDEDLQERYEMGRATLYENRSFADVRDQIRQQLHAERGMQEFEHFRERLIEESGLKLYEDRLKPGSL